MTAILGFILECAAIAAMLGAGVSLLTLAVVKLQPLVAKRTNPSPRADVAFVAGVLPAIVAIVCTVAAAMPSLAAGLGLFADHCHEHSHHLHLCFAHGPGIRPDVAALGALALMAWVVRAALLFRQGLAFARDVRRLEQLGAPRGTDFPVVEIPGNTPLCHAIGVLRRRILLSTSLLARLAPSELRCALAHERAHLRRADPLASLLLSVAGLFMLPPIARSLQRAYRTAAEDACDDDAARTVGDATLVAGALVAVARLQQHSSWQPAGAQAFGFGQHRLEARVRRLLDGSAFAARRAYALPAAAAAALIISVAALDHAAFFHHAVETALHHLF